MGHIGLTPQSSGQLGGFKAQGRTAETAKELIAQYTQEARNGQFPKEEHAYHMIEGELQKLYDLLG